MGVLTGYGQNPKQTTSFLFGKDLRVGTEIPINIIRSATSLTLNVAANTILARSAPCPYGFSQRIQDYSFSFSTAGTGVAQLVRLTSSGEIRNIILPVISNSASGIGQSVVNAGECLAVIVGTQGTGTINSIDLSGINVFIGNEVN